MTMPPAHIARRAFDEMPEEPAVRARLLRQALIFAYHYRPRRDIRDDARRCFNTSPAATVYRFAPASHAYGQAEMTLYFSDAHDATGDFADNSSECHGRGAHGLFLSCASRADDTGGQDIS